MGGFWIPPPALLGVGAADGRERGGFTTVALVQAVNVRAVASSSSEPDSALPTLPHRLARVVQRALDIRCINWKGAASVVEGGAGRAVR